MNRNQHSALISQYAAPEVSGDGTVSWENGKKCVIPSAKLYGAAVQDGTPTPDAPIMPVCNNGVFVSRGSNLLDFYATATGSSPTPTLYDGLSVSQNGLTAVVNGKGSVRITGTHTYSGWTNIISVVFKTYPTLPAGTYTAAKGLTIQMYDNTGSIINRSNTFTITYPFQIRGFYITYYGEGTVVNDTVALTLNAGDAALPWEPYYDGGQAQAPELWAIPGTDYRDEWDPQTGRGVRRVGRAVLTGAEDVWLVYGSQGSRPDGTYCYYINDNRYTLGYGTSVCSHFVPYNLAWAVGTYGTYSDHPTYRRKYFVTDKPTVEAWKSWLAEQYAAGTPVTIWYALATPEPFTSPPARLTQPRGFGQIVQVSGDIPDCPITAKYLTHS